VKALEDVLFLEAGDMHTCAILADESIRCWGSNIAGQLGNNGTASSSVPVEVIM
jgi:alpha-tubulin suppressor-like RCC1 family protein